LILVMGMHPVNAVGTDLMFAAITKISGGVQHFRQKTVQLDFVFWLALGSLPASYLGARYILSHLVEDSFITAALPRFLGVVLLVVGGAVLARTFGYIRLDPAREKHWPPPWALVLVGMLGGLLVGLTSVGGGTVIVALLLIFFTLPTDRLVGMDVVHGATLALFSAASYAWAGQTDWPLLGWLLIGSLPGAWLGARAVKRLPQSWVRGVLAVILLLVGARLLLP